MVVVTSAYKSDQAGAKKLFAIRLWRKALLIAQERIHPRLNRLVLIWVDAGYQGKEFMKWVMDTYRWILEVVRRPAQAIMLSIVQFASPLLISWVIFVSTMHNGAELPGNINCALPLA